MGLDAMILAFWMLSFKPVFSLSCIGEGNGNPLQYSCLENPRDRGAWWAFVYGVARSWTRLKQLSSSSSSSSMVFPVVRYGCQSWTIKKAEHQRINTFELWCWRKLLRVPWTVVRANQSILKEINPEYSLEGLMLKLQYLATWCKEPTHWKRPWLLERLRAEEGDRGWGRSMASLTLWTWAWANSREWWRTGKPGILQSTGSQRAGCN